MHVPTHTLISFTKGQVQLEYVLHHLKKEGTEPLVATEEPLYFVWCLFQNSEDGLSTANQKFRRAYGEAHGRNERSEN